MNILLWVLQALLALHTLIGAFWKFSNSAEQTMPSLGGLSGGLWISLAVVEILCSLGLLLPAIYRPMASLAPISAALIASEMLLFSILHIYSGATDFGPMIYWLVVAALCAFVAYGRFILRPLKI